ncbi:MAG: polymer-forming cytoskeletal protein [Cyclobacteriaceae bacterium]|nr:polymer-forming cytoskeletal protein [Cyclobacteriaceae bacterium]
MISKKYLLIIGVLVPLMVYAAAKTIDTVGDWSATGTWAGGVPGTTGDDVSINNNTGAITITTASNPLTVTTLDMGSGNTLNINSGVTFTVDNTGLDAFTTNNNTTLNVVGDLVINGNLIVNNNLTLNVTGTLTVNGDVTINNGGTLDIAGSVSVTGDLSAGTNTDISVNGDITVDGTLDTGNGSTVTGTGTVDAGTCIGEAAVCNDAQLPIKLLFFNANTGKQEVDLSWATYEEENFDYFSVERSPDGINFSEITRIKGNGWSQDIINYSFSDISPIYGRSYYRLKSVDFDGYTEYFNIERVDYLGAIKLFSVFPNPVSAGRVQVSLSQDPGSQGKLTILNTLGREVYRINLTAGVFKYEVPDFTQKGLFLFRIDLPGDTYTQRVLVK